MEECDFGRALRLASDAGQAAGLASAKESGRRKWGDADLQAAITAGDAVLRAHGFSDWLDESIRLRAERAAMPFSWVAAVVREE